MQLVGTLPVSAVNVGLAASIGGLNSEILKLQADISGLQVALAAQADVALNLPNLPTLAANLAADVSLPEIAAALNPANWATIGADLSADVALELGFIDAQLAVVAPLVATLQAGASAGGISGWSYAGRATGFGPQLTGATRFGYGGIGPNEQVQGIVVATEGLASWRSFAAGVDVGGTPVAATPAEQRLAVHGPRSGLQWNSGVAQLLARIELFLANLRGAKASLEATAQVALGLDLPDAQLILDASAGVVADVGVDGLFDNLVNVNADITAGISGLQIQVDATLSLVASLSADLSAGGLAFWSYQGTAAGLGPAVTGVLERGIPGGSGPGAVVYGLALAGRAPAMSTFGSIFKTAA